MLQIKIFLDRCYAIENFKVEFSNFNSHEYNNQNIYKIFVFIARNTSLFNYRAM